MIPRLVTLTIVSVAVLATGCASNRPSGARAVGPGDIVRHLQLEIGAERNDHPVQLGAGQLRQMLSRIKVAWVLTNVEGDHADDSGEQVPSLQLFQGQDLDGLAQLLSTALARATPDQDIGIRVSQLRSDDRLELLKASRITAARIFQHDGKLHLIFGRLDDDPRAGIKSQRSGTPRTAIAQLQDPALSLQDDVGSRRMGASLGSRILPTGGVGFPQSERTDWITLSPSGVSSDSSPSSARASNVSKETRTSVDEARDIRNATIGELESKLTELRKLRDAGLITDEAYQATMRRLLDSHF